MAKDDLSTIASFLNSLDSYVILRNHDLRKSLASGGDIDVLVSSMDSARTHMQSTLGRPWWVIQRSYVEGCFYSWGHVDLTPRIEWHGAVYIPKEWILNESSTSSFGFKQPRLAHEAIISWFASLIWGGFFKERYRPILLEAAQCDTDALSHCLTFSVGKTWGHRLMTVLQERRPEVSVEWKNQLRRALWWRAFWRHPIETILGWWQYWRTEIGLRLAPPIPLIAIAGTGDIGAVLSEVESRLVTQIKIAVIVHHTPQKLRWILSYWLRCANFRAKGFLILLDCSTYDSAQISALASTKNTSWLARLFTPSPDLTIFLTQSGSPKEISDSDKACVIDASQSLEKIADQIEQAIAAKLRKNGSFSSLQGVRPEKEGGSGSLRVV